MPFTGQAARTGGFKQKRAEIASGVGLDRPILFGVTSRESLAPASGIALAESWILAFAGMTAMEG